MTRPPTQTTQICRCGQPTRDTASTCEACLNQLYNLLTDDLPWLDEQLEVSIAGIRGASLNSGTTDGTSGFTINHRASAARRRLDQWLNHWVRFCLQHDVRNSAPNPNPPHQNAGLTERAQWLSWRVDGLAWSPSAYNAKSGLEQAVARAHEVVLWKPPVHVFLGKCGLPTIEKDPRTGKQLRCQGDVYAPEDAVDLNSVGHCRTCSQAHLVAGMRQKLEAELDRRLCTAAEIARMMIYLGADVPRRRIENRLYQWKARGVITPTPCAATTKDGAPRYRYGDIRARLAAEFKREESA